MTREEEIRKASIDYQLSTNPRAIGGDAFAEFAREMNVNPSFIAGAKWADKTMIDKACEWLEENMSVVNANAANYGDISFAASKIIGGKENFLEQFKKAMEIV